MSNADTKETQPPSSEQPAANDTTTASEATLELSKDVQATPTKELFIDMLTRDILLTAAILDLVDNCVDGARRLKGGNSFKGLSVHLLFDANSFLIKDNCGGMSIKTAKEVAFRFGRPEGAMTTKHSIGRFGVGMKRAIFKMGRFFTVESATKKERFKIELNVNDWAKATAWGFDFAEEKTGLSNPKSKWGTTVTVKDLKGDVSETLGQANYRDVIETQIATKLTSALELGLSIYVNKKKVKPESLVMRSSRELQPAVFRETYITEVGKPKISVVLYCGLGNSEHALSAGWHVFCNGRKIVDADRTPMTGWGTKGDSVKIPAFHAQFNLIRGYAFFDCDDASLLPWNTTKTGVNADAGIYRGVKLEMMTLMRPVVDFCNKLKEEREGAAATGRIGPLSKLLEKARVVPLDKIKGRKVFEMPAVRGGPAGPKMQRISCDQPLEEAQRAKKTAKAESWKELGEIIFGYYYDNEVDK